ncbi:MAG: hypothetical protein ACK4ND_19555, partial [Cytophagaceae bacterium]
MGEIIFGKKECSDNLTELPLSGFYDSNKLLKQGIWIYFWLLIFEGALRKWFLPGLATPLLVVRDPVAIFLILSAWHKRILLASPYLIGMVLIGLVGLHTALLFGHGSFPVALFGARILLIHFPVIFVIGKVFDKADVLKMGRTLLIVAIPMAFLIALQFYSPQEAWVNRGIGGEGSAGFSGALGYFRPPGTFSFTNGVSLFFGMVACLVFYFWLNPSYINRFILLAASASLLTAIPLSISRSLLFQVGVISIFAFLSIWGNAKHMGRMLATGMGVLILIAVLSQTSFFQTSVAVFTHRFENATELEGGMEGVLLDRYLGGLVGALYGAGNLPF